MPASPANLDHAATSPLLPAARDAMIAGWEMWANASSPHGAGRRARAALEETRVAIAHALGWDGHILFTSSASEALALALRQARVGHHFAGATEHDAVLRHVPAAQRLPVSATGQVITDGTELSGALVAVQQVNSETGVIQPLDRIAADVRAQGGFLLSDCAQGAGKLPLPDADMIVLSAHKFGGPVGTAALLVRDLAMLDATGGQEQGYRAGTEAVPLILGMAAALEADRGWLDRSVQMRMRLEAALVEAGGEVVAAQAHRLHCIGAYRMPGVSARAQLIRFDAAGIAVSAGSACSSGSLRPSHVLTAMGWDATSAGEVIRVSFGWSTTGQDVDAFIDRWRDMAQCAQP